MVSLVVSKHITVMICYYLRDPKALFGGIAQTENENHFVLRVAIRVVERSVSQNALFGGSTA